MNRCSLSFRTSKWQQSQCYWLVSSTAQFIPRVMDVHCFNQHLLKGVITRWRVWLRKECFQKFKCVLADFEKLCFLDNAKRVASKVLLLTLVPWQTGCSASDRCSSLNELLWFSLSELIPLLSLVNSWSESGLSVILSSISDAVSEWLAPLSLSEYIIKIYCYIPIQNLS